MANNNTDILQSLQQLNEVLQKLEVPLYDSGEEDLLFLAPILKELSAAKSMISEYETTVARYAAQKMSGPVQDVGGIVLQRGAATKTTNWDTDSLLSVLLARSRDERSFDEETGAYESEVSAFLRVLKDCVGIPYFKVGKEADKTGLLGRGIDPDEYREKKPVPQKASVQK